MPTDPLTDADLERVRAESAERRRLREAATPGPAYAHNADDDYAMNAYVVSTGQHEPNVDRDEKLNDHKEIIAVTLLQSPRVVDHAAARWEEDADYIAHCYNVPADRAVDVLLAEVERLRMELTGYQKAYELLQAGMESLSESRDELKQRCRYADAEIGRLRHFVVDVHSRLAPGESCGNGDWQAAMDGAMGHIERLRAEAAEVLRPFALVGLQVDLAWDDNIEVGEHLYDDEGSTIEPLTVGDCRRAAELLARIEGAKGAESPAQPATCLPGRPA